MVDLDSIKPFVGLFWSHVDKRGADECWPWTASRRGHRSPYGSFGVAPSGKSKRTTALAHRVSWMIAHGRSVPAKMLVCHKCDEPICVNPAHLFLGTHKDNAQDMLAKGRAPYGNVNQFTGRTACMKGHTYDAENTYYVPGGGRHCRRCTNERATRYRRERLTHDPSLL